MRHAALVVALAAACSNQTPAPAAGSAADAATTAPRPTTPPPTPIPATPDAAPRASFTIQPSLDMALAREEADALTFTSGGKLPPKPPELAIFRVSRSAAVPEAERARQAKALLAATDLASQVRPGPQQPIKAAGLSGFQGEGRGTSDGVAVSLYQVVLFAPDATFTIVGRSSTERFAWYRPTFEKMVHSFQRR